MVAFTATVTVSVSEPLRPVTAMLLRNEVCVEQLNLTRTSRDAPGPRLTSPPTFTSTDSFAEATVTEASWLDVFVTTNAPTSCGQAVTPTVWEKLRSPGATWITALVQVT